MEMIKTADFNMAFDSEISTISSDPYDFFIICSIQGAESPECMVTNAKQRSI